VSESLDEVLGREKQTPEEKLAERRRWTRESMVGEAVRLVSHSSFEGKVDAYNVIAAAEQFVAFIEGEIK
jgi:hypothetical protein